MAQTMNKAIGPAVKPSRYRYLWYDPSVKMRREDWIYIAVLLGTSVAAFDLGLLIGWIWTRLL
jgi:hypothetical protein